METDARDQPMATMLSMIAAVFTLGYMAPWMVAAARGKSNHMTVFWLNLLLGWTAVGWVVALVKAAPHDTVLATHREATPRTRTLLGDERHGPS